MTTPNISNRWNELEAPLRSLDRQLEAYAEEHGMSLRRNRHDCPERGLEWGTKIHRLIQIYLEDAAQATFNVWICAAEDRGQERYWKKEFIKQAVPIDEISKDVKGLLEKCRERVDSWGSSDLEFATKLSPMPR